MQQWVWIPVSWISRTWVPKNCKKRWVDSLAVQWGVASCIRQRSGKHRFNNSWKSLRWPWVLVAAVGCGIALECAVEIASKIVSKIQWPNWQPWEPSKITTSWFYSFWFSINRGVDLADLPPDVQDGNLGARPRHSDGFFRQTPAMYCIAKVLEMSK